MPSTTISHRAALSTSLRGRPPGSLPGPRSAPGRIAPSGTSTVPLTKPISLTDDQLGMITQELRRWAGGPYMCRDAAEVASAADGRAAWSDVGQGAAVGA